MMSKMQTLRWFSWLLPSAVAALLYLQVLNHDYISLDDSGYTHENPVVADGITWKGLAWAFQGSYFANYHPLTWLSHMLDFSLFGDSPGWFAFENALLHALNAWLVAVLLAKLLQSRWLGLVGGVIFAAHPAMVEAVAWISQRKTVLSTFWVLISMLLYLRAMEQVSAKARRQLLACSSVCFLLSLLSKSMYVTLPALLLLLELAEPTRFKQLHQKISLSFLRKELVPLTLRLLPFAACSIVFACLTVWAQSQGGAVSTITMESFPHRLVSAFFAYGEYLLKFFHPDNLSLFYPYKIPEFYPDHVLRCGFLIGVTAALYGFRHRLGIQPVLGWMFFLVSLLPVSGLVQIGAHSHADRYLYGPVLGLILSTIVLARVIQRSVVTSWLKYLLFAAGASWIAMLSINAYLQVGKWKNDYTIARSILNFQPENPVALDLMTSHLIRYGSYQEARDLLEKRVAMYPRNPVPYAQLALCESVLGRIDQAIYYQKIFIRKSSRAGAGKANLARFYFSAGEHASARKVLEEIKSNQYRLKNTERRVVERVAERLSRLKVD